MDIVFAGICCWVDAKPPKAGKTVIIVNATRGGTRRGSEIPSHSAFIHAKHSQIDAAQWPITERTAGLTTGEDVLFYLKGDAITFDPQPSGGSINITDLPHVKSGVKAAPICPAADEIRPGFLESPNAFNVLGLVDLPPDASVSTSANGHGAMYAVLHMPRVPVTITATPFNGGLKRSLTIVDPAASIVIANVTLTDYLLGVPAPDDNHQYLVCDMFRARSTHPGLPLPEPDGPDMTANLSSIDDAPPHLPTVSPDALAATAGRDIEDFLCTFAAGCSDSQWP